MPLYWSWSGLQVRAGHRFVSDKGVTHIVKAPLPEKEGEPVLTTAKDLLEGSGPRPRDPKRLGMEWRDL